MMYVRNTSRVVFNGRCAGPAQTSYTSLIYDQQTFPVLTDWERAADGRGALLMLCSAGDDVTRTGLARARHAMPVYRSRMSATTASSGSTSKRMYHPATLARRTSVCIIAMYIKVIIGRESSSATAHAAAAAAAAAGAVLQHSFMQVQ